jgi:hypothetical protein
MSNDVTAALSEDEVDLTLPSEPMIPEELLANDLGDSDEMESDSESSFTPDYVDVDASDIEVTTRSEPLADITDKDRRRYLGALAMLYTNSREAVRFSQANDGAPPVLSGDSLDEWASSFRQALGTTMYSDDYFERALARVGGRWDQQIEDEKGQRRGMGKPKLTKVSDGESLTGLSAILKIAAVTGTGGTVLVPLPHTGIWLTIKTPTLDAVTELDARIAERKVDLGRSTRGLVFSNHQVYINKELVDFVLQHTIDCNIADWNPEKLKGLIKQTDLPILAWGMAYAIYSTGFPITQPCTFDTTKCMHVSEKMVALNRLFRVDNSRLTAKQRTRLNMIQVKHSPETLKAYADEWTTPETATFKLNEQTRIVFKIPTIEQHLIAGDRWISDIVENTERVLGSNVSPRDRNEYIRKQGVASVAQQYIHWIDSFLIEEDGAQATISDPDAIEQTMLRLSSEPEIVNELVSAIISYINDVTVALIAIPNYPCPKCKKWHRTEHSPSKYLIPLDPVTSFFTLLQLKLLSTGIKQGV